MRLSQPTSPRPHQRLAAALSLAGLALVAVACTDTSDNDADSGDLDGDSADDSGAGAASTSPTTYSGEACPTLVEGTNEGFISADLDREIEVIFPEDPEGAGLVVAWHWLGGSASDIVRYMDLQDLADDHGFIVVAPDARASEAYEWDFLSGPDDNADAILFDDIIACMHAQHSIDIDNIHTTGMSAGGLWTTWLTIYRSDILATTAPLSGGLSQGTYISPAAPIPVMLTWGGTSDSYGGFSFDDASQYFSEQLQADGHPVVECVHNGGHTIPTGATATIGTFFADHPRAATQDPYADGLPDTFPSYCAIP